MSTTTTENITPGVISGFYYDLQKNDELTSVSLHANRKYDKATESFIKYDDSELDSEKYCIEPLARAIFTEDFGVGVSNDWSDFNAGDPVSELWDKLKPVAAFGDLLQKGIADMKAGHEQTNSDRETHNAKKGNENDQQTQGLFEAVSEKVVNILHKTVEGDKGKDFFNRKLISQGTRFAQFGGTGTSFSNLQMKFTIFPDTLKNPDTGKIEYKSVSDQLSDLVPYFIGKFETLPLIKEDNAAADYINNFVGWQHSPGGYQSNLLSVDNNNMGTLKLKIGGYYSIPSLVIRDAMLNFSRQMAKNPKDELDIGPLYCEVTLMFQPSVRYSSKKLEKLLQGDCADKSLGTKLQTKLEALESSDAKTYNK